MRNFEINLIMNLSEIQIFLNWNFFSQQKQKNHYLFR